ncbi:MAG: TIR domain-containing protein [Candidatus Limisoma sp.]
MAYDIFISYRRTGGYETAKHLYDLLVHDGFTVSFDIDTLRNGLWTQELENRIAECKDFVIILNRGAFDRSIDGSTPFEKDWLRRELAKAIELKKNIVPVLLDGFEFPENLPDDIRLVAEMSGPKYNSYYFDAFYEKLKSGFLTAKPQHASPTVAVLKLSTDMPCSVYIDGEKKCDIQPGNIVKLPMNPGQYSLRCVSTVNPAMFIFLYVELAPGHEKLQFINLSPQQKPYNQPPQQQQPRQGGYQPAPQQPRKKKKDRTLLIVIGCVVGFLLLCFIIGFVSAMIEDSSSSNYDYNYEDTDTVAVPIDTEAASPQPLYPYYDSESGLYGYKNADGEVMYVPQFEDAGTFDGDTVTIVRRDGVYLYFTISGYLYEIEAPAE